MLYNAAPMEGITTYIYRRAHARWYGGIDKYFTPFIAGKKMTAREVRDILPENNDGVVLVPQILTNKAGDFLEIAQRIAAYGYDTVNLNLGCPSGTVTAKKRGAGFLGEPEALDAFLAEIYEKCPLKISIKTRLGIQDLKEWDRLLDIYAKYPVQELIVHTRLLREFYTGAPHPEAYAKAAERLHSRNIGSADSAGIPLCYNGDILSAESLWDLRSGTAGIGTPIDRVMIGRGLLRNPALGRQLRADAAHTATGQSKSDAMPAIAAEQMQSVTMFATAAEQTQSGTMPAITAEQMQSVTMSAIADEQTQTCNGCNVCHDFDCMHDRERLRAFHDEILDGYREIMSGDSPVLFKMKDLWTYMIMAFASPDSAQSSTQPGRQTFEKYLKKIRKADRISEYLIAVDNLFREQG